MRVYVLAPDRPAFTFPLLRASPGVRLKDAPALPVTVISNWPFMFRPKSKTNVFAAGVVTFTADSVSCVTTGGALCARRTPSGAIAIAAATHAESSNVAVFHPAGSRRGLGGS